ncbi:hypothetical protein Daura_21430 [Dactylosporangium aurantiacum]|uniref:Uncharacterized protein n=1 Tax=Dactylosporangium aurantiacum TaxID=35754 RepID=A0A9Q9MMT0_9ACTN|nr:hypothetical protein [Dactylosporangium aurantiacum]MDG6108299.1 hypothetical protein [Dactylosporangium aurantiacum]UWZ58511.1 hypothetical protein Daura_21430 [Dactylosporangium aurantiacum]
MTTLRQLLQRFRPAGPPGTAGQAAVPADLAARTEEELRPVFSVLAAADAEAAAIRAEAEAAAARRRHRAGVAAQRIATAAHARAQQARVEAFAAARADTAQAVETVMADARCTAAALRARAWDRLDAATVSIVSAVLGEVYGTGRGEGTP